MKPETRTKNLMTLLGWQGGTIHDACKEIGCDVHDFLYETADFSDTGPCSDFRRGYEEAEDIAIYLSANRGNLQYWFGAVSAVQNGFEIPKPTTFELNGEMLPVADYTGKCREAHHHCILISNKVWWYKSSEDADMVDAAFAKLGEGI